MPPKVKITKEDIICTAVEMVRRDGADVIRARAIAGELNCSTQPVFSNFATMEDLRCAVLAAADELYQAYISREIAAEKYPPYKAAGMAYIRFAAEEKELFKLLFMRDRSAERKQPETEGTRKIMELVQASTGFSGDKAALFHLEMWIYVHGIAAMTATDYLKLEPELISEMVTDAYQGMKKRYEAKE